MLDEFPLLADMDGSTAPLLQRFIDHDMKHTRLMLVVCRQYVLDTERCRWIGRWWGSSPVVSNEEVVRGEDGRPVMEDADIDIVAEVENDHNVDLVLCECKFTHRMVGMREYENLVNRGLSARRGYQNKRHILFSRAGFTDELREFAEDNPGMRIELVPMDDIHAWSEGYASGHPGRV